MPIKCKRNPQYKILYNFETETDFDFQSGIFQIAFHFNQIYNRFRFMLMNYRCKQEREREKINDKRFFFYILNSNNNNNNNSLK